VTRIVAAGHVDHGKSTIIARLLHDTGSLPDGKVDELQRASASRGVPFEWSFALDALQSERDQAVTVETTQMLLHLPQRDVLLIDAPGHREFLRNMVTGASSADAAMIVVDAAQGVAEQTLRHALFLQLLGITQAIVVVNKMDLAGYAREPFEAIRHEMAERLRSLNVRAGAFVPAVGRDGDNLLTRSSKMSWYDGKTVAEALAELRAPVPQKSAELRVMVQGVLRRGQSRTIVGRVASGVLKEGLDVSLWPSGRTAKIARIERWPDRGGDATVRAGAPVAFAIDEPYYVERGDIVSGTSGGPALVSRLRVRLLWLAGYALRPGQHLRLKVGTRTAHVELLSIERAIDVQTLRERPEGEAAHGDVIDATFRSREVIAVDDFATSPALGRFILLDGTDIVGGGTIQPETIVERTPANVVAVDHLLDRDSRAWRNGHRGAVVWLTGLPASGKSTIAMSVERRLFENGYQVYVLDGDNMRSGLCSDLTFSHSDRSENIRRVAEVAALFADAGFIVIAAFISPYRKDRDDARRAAGERFYEVHVAADVATCERRDPKGHYRKARAGEILNFSGVSDVYEEPEAPELTLDTAAQPLEESVATLLRFVEDTLAISARHGAPA
jgi:bifunctional enzyme CysN/CysC